MINIAASHLLSGWGGNRKRFDEVFFFIRSKDFQQIVVIIVVCGSQTAVWRTGICQ